MAAEIAAPTAAPTVLDVVNNIRTKYNGRGAYICDVKDTSFSFDGVPTTTNSVSCPGSYESYRRDSIPMKFRYNGTVYEGGWIVKAGQMVTQCEYEWIFGFGSNCRGHDPNKKIFYLNKYFRNGREAEELFTQLDGYRDKATLQFILWLLFNRRLTNKKDMVMEFSQMFTDIGFPQITDDDVSFVFDPHFWVATQTADQEVDTATLLESCQTVDGTSSEETGEANSNPNRWAFLSNVLHL